MLMVKNHWYAIIDVYEIKDKPLQLQRFGHNLVLWRDSLRKLNCFEDRCPHRGTALSLGSIQGDRLVCSYHGFQFNSKGQCVEIPAHSQSKAGLDSRCSALKLKGYPIKESMGLVWIWWGDSLPESELPPLPVFPNWSPAGQNYTSRSIIVPVGFCRTMEASLDFGHFYFVHRFVKIPGLGPVSEKFECEVSGPLITIRGRFAKEANNSHRGVDFEGSVLFPSLSIYDAPGSTRGKNMTYSACAPVDEENTWIHLRIHFNQGPWAWLERFYWGTLFFGVIFPIINRQDLRVATAQTPADSGSRSDQLVSIADKGIIQYLRLWEESCTGRRSAVRSFHENERPCEQSQ